MSQERWRQFFATFRLEFRKTIFSRRAAWIYLLAFAPALLFAANSIYAPRERARLAALASSHPKATAAGLRSLRNNMTREEVVQQVGDPYSRRSERRRIGPDRVVERDDYRYTDGVADVRLQFNDGRLRGIMRTEVETLADDRLVAASIFQFYYLRLAILLGCVAVFMNLIRGEMLDKSLHYYLLTPVPRDLLIAGKFAAGLAVTLTVFCLGVAAQFAAMLWQFNSAEVSNYLASGGWGEGAAYLGIAAMACIGYGGLFLAAGLLFKNPIVPATGVLLWESINLFVPGTLKKISLIYYLQSLCPVPPPPDTSRPAILSALVSMTTPASAALAVAVVLGVGGGALLLSARLARRLEINYSVE